jgi:FkbM family methyltransferase
MLLSRCRRTVDTFAPPLGRSYRLLRDATNRRRARQTPYGFALSGDPTMAVEGWEADEIAAFLTMTEIHDVVADIGANVGMYSCLAASRGKPVLAFEPSQRNLNYLYRNLWDNAFRSVEVFPMGLARRPGLGRIYGYGGIASFVPGWAQARDAHSTLVPLTTLDSVVADRFRGKKLLVKLDVEGFEIEVLAGAEKTLALAPKPTWLVEILLHDEVIPGGVNPKFAETFGVFWSHGYQCHKLDAARTRVEPEDVTRWVCNGSVEAGTHDFCFSAD